MAVVAAEMFAQLVSIVAIMTASAQAGYLHSPGAGASGGRSHVLTTHHGSSYSRPGVSYVANYNSPYAVRSYSAPSVASQSAYSSAPLTTSHSVSYSQSTLQAPYTSAHYTSSQSSHLPSSQSVHYANSQSAPSGQNLNYISTHSIPQSNSQSANYAFSQNVPLPNGHSANYEFSQNVPLPISQSVNYAMSQSAPLSSSQSVAMPSSQNVNYASSQNSLLPSQSGLYSAQTFPTASNQLSSYTTGQNSYAAPQNSPYISIPSASQGNRYSVSQGSHAESKNSPYPAAQTSYTANSQSTSQSVNQVASQATSQSPQDESDYHYNNGQYQYHTGSTPVEQDHNYQIVHHTSESNENQGNSHSENFITTQTVSHQTGGIVLDQSYSSGYASQVASPMMPVVTKHIYFHEPPPDVEQGPVQLPSVPPKKVYNIIFIKVPSQDFRRVNGGTVQAVTASQQPRIEDKTLIYVLVKKPEPQSLPQLPPVNSEHEVFYVKYKGDVNEVANQINGKLSQQTALRSDVQAAIEPVLQAVDAGNSFQPAVQQALPAPQTGVVNNL